MYTFLVPLNLIIIYFVHGIWHTKNSTQDGRSLWLGGMFDYHGLSDYVPLNRIIELYTKNSTESVQLLINDDNVLEPDEVLIVAIYTPGRVML